jgi:hypothetical protein
MDSLGRHFDAKEHSCISGERQVENPISENMFKTHNLGSISSKKILKWLKNLLKAGIFHINKSGIEPIYCHWQMAFDCCKQPMTITHKAECCYLLSACQKG